MAAPPRLAVSIDVPALGAGVDFYTQGLGFEEVRRFDDESVCELRAGDQYLYLMVRAPGSAPHPGGGTRDYGRHWTPLHLDLLVDDLETAVERARAAGAELEGEVEDHGAWREAHLHDPFGHGFCLLQGWPLGGGGG